MKESLEKIVLPPEIEHGTEKIQKVPVPMELSQRNKNAVLVESKDQETGEQEKNGGETDRIEKAVRDFSKNFSAEERKEVAQEAMEKRRIYFEEQKSLGENIALLHMKAEEGKKSVESIGEEIEKIEQELNAREKSLVSRFLNTFGISKRLSQLRAELGAKREMTGEFENELFENQELIRDLEKQRQDRSGLEEAKKSVVKFYGEQAHELKEQMDVRDVSRQTKRTGEFFIHAIHPDFIPSTNSMLNVDTEWQTKLDIFLAFQPTVSTSSIGAGNTPENMWARMGVVVSNGSIEVVSSSDAGTKATSLKKREGGGFSRKTSDADIDEAVKLKGNHYNEITVALPRIAGFFICRDRDEREIPLNLVPSEEIVEKCQSLNMPIFEIINGVLHETEWNCERSELTATKLITPDEISKRHYDISEEKRRESVERFLEKSPFKVVPKDIELIECRTSGRDTYIVINKERVSNAKGTERKFQLDGPLDDYRGIQKESAINLVSEFPSVHGKVLYFTKDGELYHQWINSAKKSFYKGRKRGITQITSTEKCDSENWAFMRAVEGLQEGRIELDNGLTKIGGQPISDSDSYITGMQDKIKEVLKEGETDVSKYKIKLEEAKTARDKEYIRKNLLEWANRRCQEEVRKLASHIYGFAEQAEVMGDLETAHKAKEIAYAFLPENEYQKILKRVDADGNIKLKKEDIGLD